MPFDPAFRKPPTDGRQDTPTVWDPLVRIFHWSLVIFFTIAYATGDELEDLHTLAGYTIAGLVAFRLAWGVIGTRHARFTDFVAGPGRAFAYLRALVRGRAPRYLGHNPAGGLMIVALLASLAVTAAAGIAMIGVDGAGPLAGLVPVGYAEPLEEVHEFFANLTLLLILTHVTGVVVGSIAHRENLVRSMINGRKLSDAAWRRAHPESEPHPDAGHAST